MIQWHGTKEVALLIGDRLLYATITKDTDDDEEFDIRSMKEIDEEGNTIIIPESEFYKYEEDIAYELE